MTSAARTQLQAFARAEREHAMRDALAAKQKEIDARAHEPTPEPEGVTDLTASPCDGGQPRIPDDVPIGTIAEVVDLTESSDEAPPSRKRARRSASVDDAPKCTGNERPAKRHARCMTIGHDVLCTGCKRMCDIQDIVYRHEDEEFCPKCFVFSILQDNKRNIPGEELFASPRAFVETYMRDC